MVPRLRASPAWIGSVAGVVKSDTSTGRRIRGLDSEQRRAQRREALLDAALDLFAAQGYLHTSIEQICQHAYVGTKSFYEVFDGREACYLALLRRNFERMMSRVQETLASSPDDEEQASQALIDSLARSFADDIRLAKVSFGAGSPSAVAQRRDQRRITAEFIEDGWLRFGAIPDGGRVSDGRSFYIALGLVGGLFEIVTDWVAEVDSAGEAEFETLRKRLTSFYGSIRNGLPDAG